MQLEIRDNTAESRFEILTDGQVAGSAPYLLRPDAVVLTHTEVDPARRGQGLGEELARGALNQVRSRGGRVVPQCPFIAEFIRRNPEYADLVVA